MDQQHKLFLQLMLLVQVLLVTAQTSSQDYNGLGALTGFWSNRPPNWVGTDPCGNGWEGIRCTNSRITQLKLLGMNLVGQMSSAIQSLSELETLDLSYNTGLTGTIPKEIGNLTKLKSLALVGCGFSGPIPDSIGALQQLAFLALNSNKFNGTIPHSIGNLSNINWLDIADNQFEGPIPVSDNQGRPGLDLLLEAEHFHMGNNKLSGPIPAKLFNSSMKLLHVLLDSNQLNGSIPNTLGDVGTLEVVRLDRNELIGGVPSSFKSLGKLNELYLSQNKLNGSLPDLSGMDNLVYVDMSKNSFSSSNVPPWVSSLPNLTTVLLGDNRLSGTFNLSSGVSSSSLQIIDLRDNEIINYVPPKQNINFQVVLAGNRVCLENGVSQQSYCRIPLDIQPYSTLANNCTAQSCSSDQVSSPNCKCAYPYTGTLFSRALSVSVLNDIDYKALEQSLLDSFQSQKLHVDSVSLSNPLRNTSSDYFQLTLSIFPSQTDRFNRTGLSSVAFVLSNQKFKPPEFFSPYFFNGLNYAYYGGEPEGSKSSHTGVIIGAVAAVLVFVVLAFFAGIYALRQKRRASRSEQINNPFANWELNTTSGTAPQLKGARWFSFEDLKKYTNSFSETNTIGSGGYGKVYQGVLPAGEIVAIKRAAQESMQGALEFKTEIELLSRVHHKNLVSLVGFCFEKGEQMLVYEYIPNGTILDSLTGKSGIWMDWIRRLKVALGAARGLSYLHELANPPIIHRDIKSSNILLDDHLNAKVADFGLSKLLVDSERGHITTQVKGTMGYLDPEYYMTQQLTEKSDVYSFGVVMLELVTARRPIEQGKYIVREVMRVMDTSKDLYNLHSILDPTILKVTSPKGLEKFVELAMRCVKEYAAERPTMAEVVKGIENIIELAGVNPNAESASTTESYDVPRDGDAKHPYSNEDFSYSGMFPTTKVEPQ